MNEEQIFHAIIKVSVNKTDLNRRIRLLRDFFEQKFFAAYPKKMEEYFTENGATEADLIASKEWGEEFQSFFNAKNLYETINNLSNKAHELPVVTVYFPILPSETDVQKFGDWFRENMDPSVLMDIRIDPALGAGCAFVWQGKYHNYSLRYYIDKEREQILSLLSRYAREHKQQ